MVLLSRGMTAAAEPELSRAIGWPTGVPLRLNVAVPDLALVLTCTLIAWSNVAPALTVRAIERGSGVAVPVRATACGLAWLARIVNWPLKLPATEGWKARAA